MSAERIIWSLSLAIAAIRIGYGAVIPTMPLYAQEHGLSTAMLAAMTNAYLLTNTVLQGVAGHWSDRFGRRPVMLAGASLYTVAAALFVFDGGPWYYVLLRGLEGAGAAAFGPVARAYLADLIPSDQRGRAFGRLMSADMAGILIGPVIGGVAQGMGGMKMPFVVCAVLGAAAVGVLLTLGQERSRPAAAQGDDASAVTTGEILRSPAFWAVALPGLGLAYLTALYSVAWSLYMQAMGATLWQINLSYTLFAAPMVILLAPVGRLSDRYGRTLFVGLGGAVSAAATFGYGLAATPWPLLLLCLADGVGTSLFGPASQAFMADVTPPGIRGRFMGLAGSLSTGATVLAAWAVGAMYGRLPPALLFGLGSVSLALCSVGSVILMRRLGSHNPSPRPSVRWSKGS